MAYPYDNMDALSAMSALADGSFRRRRLGNMPYMPGTMVDPTGLPGVSADPNLSSRRNWVTDPVYRLGTPGRRQQGLIPMVPPFTNPVRGPVGPTPVGPVPGLLPRQQRRRERLFPLRPQPTPTVGPITPTLPSPGFQYPITPTSPTMPGPTTGLPRITVPGVTDWGWA